MLKQKPNEMNDAKKSPNMYPNIRMSRISHPRATSWGLCLLVIAVAAFGLFVSLSTDAATVELTATETPRMVQYIASIWH